MSKQDRLSIAIGLVVAALVVSIAWAVGGAVLPGMYENDACTLASQYRIALSLGKSPTDPDVLEAADVYCREVTDAANAAFWVIWMGAGLLIGFLKPANLAGVGGAIAGIVLALLVATVVEGDPWGWIISLGRLVIIAVGFALGAAVRGLLQRLLRPSGAQPVGHGDAS